MAGIFQNGIYQLGLDYFTTVTQIFDTAGFGTLTLSNANSRFGVGQGMSLNGGWVQKLLGTNLSTIIVGYAFKVSQLPSSNTALITFGDVTNNLSQTILGITPTGALQFFAGNGGAQNNGSLGTARGSATVNLVSASVWYYLEVEIFFSSSSGTAAVRFNGASSSATTYSGSTLAPSGSPGSYTNAVYFYGENSVTQTIDDIYMLDTTGSGLLSTFLGDVRITTVVPTGDSATGGLNAFSTSPSQTTGNHWNNVKEIPPDDNTSYNFDSTVSDRESYKVGTVSLTGQILSVNQVFRAEKDDAGTRSIAAVARNNSIDTTGSTITMPSSYAYFNQIFLNDPNTGSAWTQSGFNTAEFGVIVIS